MVALALAVMDIAPVGAAAGTLSVVEATPPRGSVDTGLTVPGLAENVMVTSSAILPSLLTCTDSGLVFEPWSYTLALALFRKCRLTTPAGGGAGAGPGAGGLSVVLPLHPTSAALKASREAIRQVEDVGCMV